ncbi:MAG TPA: 5'-methylthioadenosine/S-adenosylhomocysteine nucleosidase [Rhizobacter sp.]|nr:5'-methylthioadenosine/S-adenosylhomocysteine nucleosidase [Rhizobacter sp.]
MKAWLLALAVALSMPAAAAEPAPRRCLSECTPRIGIVSAFGAEADILLAQTTAKRVWTIHGKRYTTGTLRGNRVVIVLSGVSMINAAMTTQQLLDHFRIERLVMSGIAGGINPAHRVGDVTVPDRWAMPMEVYWNADGQTPSPCGSAGDVGCLGLKLAAQPPYQGWFVRENHVLNDASAPQGEFRLDYPADAEMLQVARTLKPPLERCGPRGACVGETPRLLVGGRGVSGTAFLANAEYRRYLADTLQAETVDMETAALAHVARSNGVPYIAFRSLSDLAGATEFNADVGALFSSGLAEANEAAVTLAFLEAWKRRPKP